MLEGITGSGKTEVYLHAISKALKQGRNALMLVPEISLTPQMVRQVKARFGQEVAVLHSAYLREKNMMSGAEFVVARLRWSLALGVQFLLH